jgi:hypothetical protein
MFLFAGPLVVAAVAGYFVNDLRDAVVIAAGAAVGLLVGIASYYAATALALVLGAISMVACAYGLLWIFGLVDSALGMACFGLIGTTLLGEYGLATLAARRR